MHEFTLIHVTAGYPEPGFTEPRYESIRQSPPAGCTPTDIGGRFGLECRRDAPTLLEAVAQVCAEARAHGIVLTDLGVEKLWEWSSDGQDGFGATIVGQLLLMASYRGELLGYTIDDLVQFLRTAGPR